MMLRFIALVFAALAFVQPAAAQWQTPTHSVPLGIGAGQSGFRFATPGPAGIPLVSNGAAIDPSFQVVPNAGLAPAPANTVKCNPTAGTANVQDCTPTQATGAGFGRIKLNAATGFFVDRTNGTDVAGCGLASGAAACQSPQFMANILLSNYDLGGQVVTITLAHSASNYAPFSISMPWVGGNESTVTFVGDVASQSSVVIDGGGGAFCAQASSYGSFTIRGLTVQNCANAIAAIEEHAHIMFDHITWSSMPAGSSGIFSSRQSYVEVVGGGNIINSIGASFLTVSHQGNFRAAQSATGATPFTLGANVTCTAGPFAFASSQGDITFTQYTASAFSLGGHTATCQQWTADSQGLIQALNASTGAGLTTNFFPGGTAGICTGDCSIDQGAHAGTTVSSCGTGAAISGNDFYGTVTTGSTATTSCVVVFASGFSRAPICLITWSTGTVPTALSETSSVSTIGVTFASQTGGSFTYFCKGG